MTNNCPGFGCFIFSHFIFSVPLSLSLSLSLSLFNGSRKTKGLTFSCRSLKACEQSEDSHARDWCKAQNNIEWTETHVAKTSALEKYLSSRTDPQDRSDNINWSWERRHRDIWSQTEKNTTSNTKEQRKVISATSNIYRASIHPRRWKSEWLHARLGTCIVIEETVSGHRWWQTFQDPDD